jgi:hypothetical protein
MTLAQRGCCVAVIGSCMSQHVLDGLCSIIGGDSASLNCAAIDTESVCYAMLELA